MGDGEGFKDKTPTLRGQFEFIQQAGLAQPGFTHHPHDLATTCLRLLQCSLHLVQLTMATHKAGETPASRHLETGPEWASAQHLVDMKRLFDPFDVGLPQRFKLEITVREAMGLLGHKDRPRSG